MEIEKCAHDWIRVKSGNRRFEVEVLDIEADRENYLAEVEKLKKLTLEEFLEEYKGRFDEL